MWYHSLLPALIVLAPATDAWSNDGPREIPTTSPRQQRQIRLSYETTRIVEPLTPDGYPDYTAALDREFREGVTPENNAAVLLFQAFGPDSVPEHLRTEVFKRLGVPAPVDGPFFALPPDRIRDDEFRRQLDQACAAAWGSEDFPRVARWLESNALPLGHVVAASERTRYYAPILTPNSADSPSALVLAWNGGLWDVRVAASALIARAMLKLHDGDAAGARHDLRASHRLAALLGQHPVLLNALTAVGIHAATCRADQHVALVGGLTDRELADFDAELRRLMPLPDLVQRVDHSARFAYLDMVAHVARGGRQAHHEITGFHLGDDLRSRWTWYVAFGLTSWNRVLMTGNARFDEWTAALRRGTAAERDAAMEDLVQGRLGRAADLTGPYSFLYYQMMGYSRRQIATAVVGEMLGVSGEVDFRSVERAIANSDVAFASTLAAIALARYHRRHGSWPESLTDLSPGYLPALPLDAFDDKPIRYRVAGRGFVLYSVGPNGLDDDGRTEGSDPPGDDITVATAEARE